MASIRARPVSSRTKRGSSRPTNPFYNPNTPDGQPHMDPETAAKDDLMSYLTSKQKMTPAVAIPDKVGTWSTFVAKKPTQWSPPDYSSSEVRPVSSRTKTAIVERVDKTGAKTIMKELAARPLSFNGYVLKPGEKPTGKSEYPEVGGSVSTRTKSDKKKVHNKPQKRKSKKKSKSEEPAAAETFPSPALFKMNAESTKSGSFISIMAQEAGDEISKGDGDGDRDDGIGDLKLSKMTEEMLKQVAANALDNLELPKPKVFPVVPQNSLSTIELNYRLTKQGLPVSERYAQHGVKSDTPKKADPNANKSRSIFVASDRRESKTVEKVLAAGNAHSPISSATLLSKTQTSAGNQRPISTSSPLQPTPSLLAHLPFLWPNKRRPSRSPKPKDRKPLATSSSRTQVVPAQAQKSVSSTRPASAAMVGKSVMAKAVAAESDRREQFKQDVKDAVAAIINDMAIGKSRDDTTSTSRRQASAGGFTHTTERPASKSSSNKAVISEKKSSKTKGKNNKSVAKIKSKEITSVQGTSGSPAPKPGSAVAVASLTKKGSDANTSVTKHKNSKRPATAEPKQSNVKESGSSLATNFSRAQHNLIDAQWKHVYDRQVALESEVLQLLKELQERTTAQNSGSDEVLCCCDSETKHKLEALILKEKEVIQLQMDLHQRYGFNHLGTTSSIGKNHPILNAFEAHYGQLSPFAREINGKMAYYCGPCNFSAKDELAFRGHLESSGHVVRTYQGIVKHQPTFSCEHCSQLFSGTTKYMSHLLSSDEKGVIGPKCKQEFPKGENSKRSFQKSKTSH